MKTFIFSLLLFSSLATLAQPGFSKRYDFGLAAKFHNALLVNDTLIIAGTMADTTLQQWGALFVRMDTSGNVIDHIVHYDTTYGGWHVFNDGYGLINTSDGGYAMTSNLYYTDFHFTFMKMDHAGNLEFVKEYADNSVRTISPRRIMEISDGYLIAGTVQEEDYNIQFSVRKIDQAGNLLWEKRYGDVNLNEYLNDIIQVNDNLYILGGYRSNFSFPLNPLQDWGEGWIFAIDSTGSVQWEWIAEKNIEASINDVRVDQEGRFLYTTIELTIFDPNHFGLRQKIICRDSDFNKIWERTISPTSGPYNGNSDLIQTQDQGWVTAAHWVLPSTPYPPNDGVERWTPACMYKVNATGSAVWSRCDTMPIASKTFSNRYSSIVELSSGSIMAVGSFDELIPGIGDKVWGWVVKVDQNGCLEAPCGPVSTKAVVNEKSTINVFPNPASNFVQFEWTGDATGMLQIIDLLGTTVWQSSIPASQTSIRWECDQLSNGIYFYKWYPNNSPNEQITGSIFIAK